MNKKLLFLCTALGAFSFANAQEFLYDNYNSLTVGNVGTNVAGTVLGQGGYYTFGTGGANTNFQIVADTPAQGNVVQLTGSATATGTWYMFKDITAGWAARTAGNNVINVEFDIYTGGATTSKNTSRVYIYNSDGSTVLGGLMLNLETKALSGIAFYDPNNGGVNPVGTYSFNLGASNAVISLTASSWVRVGISYNTTTRQLVWKGPGFYVGVTGATPATGTTAPGEIDYINSAGTANTVSATSKFDNLMARANATENLLGNSSFNSTVATFSNVYPNPVVDFASISLIDATINAITVMDINGRLVKSGNSNELATAKIDLSDLTAGIYLMKIETDKGISTEKIIKK
ncbi:MAG: T9SS type A sorting domain-containing protein [Bacteroidia bacterium]|nr:T9SS type A sorting domain-containing protein [Bacteroidia bacterium]